MRCSQARVSLLIAGALGWAVRPAAAQGEPGHVIMVAPRLPPAAFSELSPGIRSELERRHCMIPQVAGDTTRHNVLRGRFRRPGQMDWAVLCWVNGYSSILVFWHGTPSQHPGEVAVATDAEYTEPLDSGRVTFVRAIAVMDSAHIPEPQSVAITHDGIRSIHRGKSSLAYYWDEGEEKWIPLVGTDP